MTKIKKMSGIWFLGMLSAFGILQGRQPYVSKAISDNGSSRRSSDSQNSVSLTNQAALQGFVASNSDVSSSRRSSGQNYEAEEIALLTFANDFAQQEADDAIVDRLEKGLAEVKSFLRVRRDLSKEERNALRAIWQKATEVLKNAQQNVKELEDLETRVLRNLSKSIEHVFKTRTKEYGLSEQEINDLRRRYLPTEKELEVLKVKRLNELKKNALNEQLKAGEEAQVAVNRLNKARAHLAYVKPIVDEMQVYFRRISF